MNHHNFHTQDPALAGEISRQKAFRFIFKLLAEYPISVAAVMLCGILAALSELIGIALFIPFVESMRENPSSSISEQLPLIGFLAPYFADLSLVAKIRIIALALLLVEAVKFAARYMSNRLSYLLQMKIDMLLRIKTFDHMLEVGLGFINKEKIANLFTILNNFTGHASQMALNMSKVVPDIFMMLITVLIMAAISLKMTFLSLVLGAITLVFMSKLTQKARILGRAANQASVRINHAGFEMLSGMSLIRMFGREKTARRRFKNSVYEFQQINFRKGLLDALASPLSNALMVFIVVVILVTATFILHRDAEFWVGILVIFLVVFSRLGGPIGRLSMIRTQLAGQTPSIQSLLEFLLRQDKQILPEGDIEFDKLKEGIRFENVSFSYNDEEGDVLSDISFAVPKGKITAIVGASGSGKSTLAALLSRLYDPTGGRIVADGTDLKEFKSLTWRRKIGVVSQSTFLFNDTVRNNICFGKPDASDEKIAAAAEIAGAHDFISAMREGYQTLLGDRGVRLSGGQAQRVAIARAILVEPELLILDEATSSLDTASERLVQEALDRVTQDRTVLVIAHRLSTIREADNIVVLENGRVVEQGKHEELIALRGKYRYYVQLQDLMYESTNSLEDTDINSGLNIDNLDNGSNIPQDLL